MKKGRMAEIVAELQAASKMHLKQSKEIAEHIDDMESPAKMTSPLNDSASSGKKHSTMGKRQLEIHIEGNNKHRNAKRLVDADKDPSAGKNQIGSSDGPGTIKE